MELNLFMNVNEECLLKFLNNPGRLETTTNQLKNTILYKNDKIIINNKEKKSPEERFSSGITDSDNLKHTLDISKFLSGNIRKVMTITKDLN
jgi:hypothetical protein